MKITFLGTRGYIDIATRYHKRHTSTLITYKGKRIMIDCGEDWLGRINDIKPHAIIITHAHPDHAWGLKKGAPCPVYASQDSWNVMAPYADTIEQQYVLKPYKKTDIFGITFTMFPVEHSILAPGVGYRITAGAATIFCVHDLVYIKERKRALRGCTLYIGDGATINRPMIRKKGGQLFGHSPISTQLTWCEKEGVPRAIFTHCGTQLVAMNQHELQHKIKKLGEEKGVDASVAYDGLSIILR